MTGATAAHMLHEQAHGMEPWRTCRQEPCNQLTEFTNDAELTPRGPAQLLMTVRG